tara:strand:+ start:4335 stop:7808 length:3474 start_codon:yes stop_codon:yes gene_type:complete
VENRLFFSKLRVTGFKSFVDPAELWIEPGLTGVVGPNGCGKSNLVEALRWVMGESSAKQMRGGEMDDIIFGGTDKRPARNIAEVLLQLDNSNRSAPSQFNDHNEIEIIRRIERGEGSQYKVNGNDIRARDVQTLFADLATGARSTALVSQGRVGALINAKPADRRQILEEAAGITGLRSRRHEAELRLKAAEKNLERLDDLLGSLDVQLRALKKQVRQSARYRNLSSHIRKAEAIEIHHAWVAAKKEKLHNEKIFTASETAVEAMTITAASASKKEMLAANELPSLRKSESRKAAKVQRLIMAQDGLKEEEQRIETESIEIQNRIQQVNSDIRREQELSKDAQTTLKNLENEKNELMGAQKLETLQLERALSSSKKAEKEVSLVEDELTQLTEAMAANEIRFSGLKTKIADGEMQRARIKKRLHAMRLEYDSALSIMDAQSGKDFSDTMIRAARTELEEARLAFDEAVRQRKKTIEQEAEMRRHLQSSINKLEKYQAEEQALREFLTIGNPELWPPMIDAVAVRGGFELALAAALGDDLNAPSNETAPVHWSMLPPIENAPSLPPGAISLSEFVDAPKALSRRLSQIGFVPDTATGKNLSKELQIGQRLVSKNGDLWRWDGYNAVGGDSGAAASRLTQRNRLDELHREILKAKAEKTEVKQRFDQAYTAREKAENVEIQAHAKARKKDNVYQEMQDKGAALNQQSVDARSRMQTAKEAERVLKVDDAEWEKVIIKATKELDNFIDLGKERENLIFLRTKLAETRAFASKKFFEHETLVSEATTRGKRLTDIKNELIFWTQRAMNADLQTKNLFKRLHDTKNAMKDIQNRPSEISNKRKTILNDLKLAERSRNQAADNLADTERKLSKLTAIRKEKENSLAKHREDRIRFESALEKSNQNLMLLKERALERIGVEPDSALNKFEIKSDAELPNIEQIKIRLEKLRRERENMGAVNLRAEAEAQELGQRIDTINIEREDLLSAISRLRTGISNLNREGRQRLLAAFKDVDMHFQELFQRLFGGGKAHLSLTDKEDPLEAGLEVMASPPGKRLQSITLLSGGEQALTAISILFAIFLTNPAPICVLDEVDAPLDDANVDRFCSIIRQIAIKTGTRFLIVTHHRLTMARVDRLFGVTMGEQGVSQLVSVDLDAAQKLRDSA